MIKRILAALAIALSIVSPVMAMTAASIPTKFSIPWGNSAGGSYIRAIPTTSQIGIQNGAASLTDGFPPLTFVPVGSGGVPPFGQDFNGILKQITQWSQWQGAGGLPKYDGTFSSAIGGYPAGAVLAGTTPGVTWVNLVDNNTTNPDAAGANWTSLLPSSGGTMTGSTINTSTIVLKQSSVPTPTAEGDIQWGTLNGVLAVGHNSATVTIQTGPAPGALFGYTLQNNSGSPTTAIDFAAGQATDSTNTLYMTKGSALTKQLNNAWTAGTNAGGLFSGSMSNGTYHCFVIENPTTGVVDAGFSTSVTASDHPTGFTFYRRVGSIIVTGGNIVAFTQYGDLFRKTTRTTDFNANPPNTSAQTVTLAVPTGIVVIAEINAGLGSSATTTTQVLFTALAETDSTLTAGIISMGMNGATTGGTSISSSTAGEYIVPTNTSGQIRYRSTNTQPNLTIATVGWTDTRGK